MRSFVVVVLLAASAVARADGDLKACAGLPHGKTTTIPDDAVVVGTKLAFPALEGGGCEVYDLGGKNAQATGTFGTAVAIDADGLALFYTVDTGSYIASTPAERRAGATPSCPIGSIVVDKTDAAKPLLRIADPHSGTLQDGKGVILAKQYAYDPAHHTLAPTGAADTSVSVDAHAGCK